VWGWSCLDLKERYLVPAGIVDRAGSPILLEHRHREGGVVHEAGAAIYPLTEIVQQVPFPNCQHSILFFLA